MSSLNPNLFIHVANVTLLLAYSVHDILWLRVLALVSSLIAIPYFVLQPVPLWAPLLWTLIFATVNLVQSSRLLLERRPVKLTSEEEEVRRLVFRELPARKVLQIIGMGTWGTVHSGERLIERGRSLKSIALIVRGKMMVTREQRILGHLDAGNLVGSALLLTGIPAEVDATAVETVRTISWEIGSLEKYLAANPDARIILQQHLAHDLAAKLYSVST